MKMMVASYHIRSPFQPSLPLHSTYIVDRRRRVIYRKNGGGRPSVRELLDALDYHSKRAARGMQGVAPPAGKQSSR